MRLVFTVIMFFLISSSAMAMDLSLTPKPNPPDVGDNQLELKLSDGDGKSVEGATIDVLVFMPAMGTMPRMEEKATVTPKGGGVYTADFDLPMGGTWEIAVSVQVASAKDSFHASLTTGIPGIASKGSRKGKGDAPSSENSKLMELGPERIQMIGVRFVEAKVVSMRRSIEAVGVVEQDQTHREEVTPRTQGYVVKQFKGRVGDSVKAGDPLFSIYSPDLVTAQSEFFLAENLAGGGQSLHQAAAEKLKNLGLSDRDVAEIKKSGKPKRDVIVRSQVNGTILEVMAREGAAVSPGQIVYVIGDLSKTYIVGRVFQQEVGDLKVGQRAQVVIPGATDGASGTLNLIYPQVEQGAGTANVRVEIAEYVPGMKPGAYVDLKFEVDLGSLLCIPAEAILYSGKHRYVFVDHGGGVLEPREVIVGKTANDMVEVRSGLKSGDRVAASGTFLLGSEAQLRSTLPKWRTDGASGAVQ